MFCRTGRRKKERGGLGEDIGLEEKMGFSVELLISFNGGRMVWFIGTKEGLARGKKAACLFCYYQNLVICKEMKREKG
jgi:hypothetical protein